MGSQVRGVATGVRLIARNLLDASRGGSQVKELRLSASPDLVCMNIMCSKVGEPCLCRLARCLSRLTNLEVLDLSGNGLKTVPDDINRLAKLIDLDLSGNRFEDIPLAVKQLPSLSVLRLDDNLLKFVTDQDVAYLRSLRRVSLGGNPLASEIEALIIAKR